MTAKLIIFAKAPRPGQVKSRLASSIGEIAACEAYQKITRLLLDNLHGLENVEIRFAPDEAESEMRKWLGHGYEYAPQGSGDLGERLQRAFQENFSAGNQRVIVIGSDCPYVTKQDIEAAANALTLKDVVLGPANDGGYWLMGLRKPQPALFQEIPWSSEKVLETTLIRISEAQLSFQLLHKLHDIDVAEDWQKFLRGRSS
ncbi:MAG: TIGR04282 family arsenosugar biosynthesis glycosyltransferase [Verrucomicrobiota bacterium]